MTWMFLGLLIFSFLRVSGLQGPHVPFVRIGRPVSCAALVLRSRCFETTDGNDGVTFANVEPPGSPADNAGLAVATSFTNC